VDSSEKLVFDSETAVGVLGRGADFVLINLTGGELDQAAIDEALSRGLEYCGVLAVSRNGQAGAKCASLDTLETLVLAAAAFGAQVAERLRPQPKSDGDAVAWLTRLFVTGSDTRVN
jgi:hypothetical protein